MGERSISCIVPLPRRIWLPALLLTLPAMGCTVSCPTKNPLSAIEQASVYPAEKAPPQGYGDPARIGAEDAWFRAADGIRLHGLFFPHPSPRAVILYAHGNGGNVGTWADVGRQLRKQHGVSVLVFDYRGYGRSEGTPSEAGLLHDARAARTWLGLRAGVAEREIVLMGRSLGGGVAVDLAASDGARGLILQSTFTSLPKVAASHLLVAPASLLMENHFDSLAKIGKYHGPVLISHGDSDRVIPTSHGKRLFAAANEPKNFFVVAGGDHNDPEPAKYHELLDQFLDDLNQKSKDVQRK